MIEVEKLKATVKEIYREPLPQNIHYHKWSHIVQVEEAVLTIAQGECVDGVDLIRLRSGVYVHDLGNLISRENHEQRGVKLAYQFLPLFGADAEDLTVVDGLVMATAIPQSPTNLLERIMCDADLSLMGYENWFETIDGYRKELGIESLEEWYVGQVNFLGSHKWFTQTAARKYDGQKQKNLERVKQLTDSN